MTKIDEKLSPLPHSASNRCFGCGPANAGGLKLEFLRAEDDSVVALPTISDEFEGPVGYLHGGIIATLLDEAMSKAVRARGMSAMTRKMDVDYMRPVPSGVPIRIEGRIVRSEGQKHWTEARILNGGAVTLASATGLFIEVRASRLHVSRRPEDRPVTD